jgi:deoxyribodipyrimidine photo-lyase
MTGLVWFRRDLRLDDNPAWAAATTGHETVAALYVLDPRLLAAAGPHRRARLEAEVAALDVELAERGGRLLVRTGDPLTVVPAEAARVGAVHTYWNADVSPYATRRDQQVAQALPDGGVTTTWGTLVLPPGSVRTGEGRVHRVFGAFHRAWRATAWDPWPEPGAATVLEDPGDGPPAVPGDAGLEAGLEGDGTGVGTAAAVDQLHRFLADGVDRYPRAGTTWASAPGAEAAPRRSRWPSGSARSRPATSCRPPATPPPGGRRSCANSPGGLVRPPPARVPRAGAPRPAA